MDPTSTPTTAHKPTLNGTRKRHQVRHPPPSSFLYRECLKNHAASLGGHALDGCGEYMPSSSFNPDDPSPLTCAACGCHRNFHRRLHRQNHLPLPPHLNDEDNDNDQEEEEEEEEEEEDDDEHFAGSVDGGCGDEVSRLRQHPTSPPPPSAPHMLLALSTGAPARKRFRSKFSPEQKERMQELSERLGWRMPKRDKGLIAERCHEIGVGRGVFKVWMHNNKHNFNKQQQQQLRSDDINGPPPPPSS